MSRIVRYLLSGGLAALANYFSRIVFSQVMPFELAMVAAFVVGLATGFLLMRRYAFAKTGPTSWRQLTAYVGVNLFGLVQTVAISSLLLYFILPWLGVAGHREEIAHAFGIVIPVGTSYLGHRWFTFRG